MQSKTPQPQARNRTKVSGTRMTMDDLAKLAGVSKMTVSRALRNSALVAIETRELVQDLARTHGYRINVSARNLRLQRSHTVAVIVEMIPSPERPMHDPFPLELLGGIMQALTTDHYNLLLTTLQGVDGPSMQLADGLILLGQGPHGDAVERLEHSGIPLVIWGSEPQGGPHVVVGSDNRQGGALVAQRFLSIGRRRLLFLGDTDHAEIAERWAGFSHELQSQGLCASHLHVPGFTFADGAASARQITADGGCRFDGVFAANDLIAMGLIRGLAEHSLRVPEDVSVLGYDDAPMATNFIPPLSTVRQNWREGGMLLARKVIDLINGDSTTSEVLPATLIVRAT